jgi:hypothetical protein
VRPRLRHSQSRAERRLTCHGLAAQAEGSRSLLFALETGTPPAPRTRDECAAAWQVGGGRGCSPEGGPRLAKPFNCGYAQSGGYGV